jgi:hypothetical protein
MEPKFKREAVLCAICIINRIPTHAVWGMNPYEKCYGSKPSIAHIRIFGSSVWAHIPKEKKMEPKSHCCILIGYNEVSKAYHLYDPSNYQVIKWRYVVFDEVLSHNLLGYFLLLSTNVLQSILTINFDGSLSSTLWWWFSSKNFFKHSFYNDKS